MLVPASWSKSHYVIYGKVEPLYMHSNSLGRKGQSAGPNCINCFCKSYWKNLCSLFLHVGLFYLKNLNAFKQFGSSQNVRLALFAQHRRYVVDIGWFIGLPLEVSPFRRGWKTPKLKGLSKNPMGYRQELRKSFLVPNFTTEMSLAEYGISTEREFQGK